MKDTDWSWVNDLGHLPFGLTKRTKDEVSLVAVESQVELIRRVRHHVETTFSFPLSPSALDDLVCAASDLSEILRGIHGYKDLVISSRGEHPWLLFRSALLGADFDALAVEQQTMMFNAGMLSDLK